MRNYFAVRNGLNPLIEIIDRAFTAVRSQDRRPAALPAASLPARRSMLEQWSCVTSILVDAQSRARRALDRHQSAASQIDAATYALQRMREEMAPAFFFTLAQPAPSPPSPTAFRREQFRRREPLAA
jgi:hypothetical protein